MTEMPPVFMLDTNDQLRINGDFAFIMWDRFGFPPDLLEIAIAERFPAYSRERADALVCAIKTKYGEAIEECKRKLTLKYPEA